MKKYYLILVAVACVLGMGALRYTSFNVATSIPDAALLQFDSNTVSYAIRGSNVLRTVFGTHQGIAGLTVTNGITNYGVTFLSKAVGAAGITATDADERLMRRLRVVSCKITIG